MRCLVVAWFCLVALSLNSGRAEAFATNSFSFENMPALWWYNPANEPPAPPGTSWEEIITEAVENWSGVPCALVSFAYEGMTDAEWAKDGVNAIFWQADEWLFNKGAAAATLHIPQLDGELREVDLALNAVDFIWTVGGGDAFQTNILDAESVFTHEFGHWLGLAHSPDQFATMYAAKLIGTMQASLDSDDKFGICTLYPSGQNECETHADCPEGWVCRTLNDIRVCGELHDPIGAHCSKDVLNCDNMCFTSFWDCSAICAFTSTDYKEGYCAGLCLNANGTEFECQSGYVCKDVPGYDIRACYTDPEYVEPGPDIAPELAAEMPEAQPDPASETGSMPETKPAPESGNGDTVGELDGGCASAAGADAHPVRAYLVLFLIGCALVFRRRRAPIVGAPAT